MISYTYQITRVDPTAKAMEIIYSSQGRQTMHIGGRMPYLGETLDQVVRMYAPLAFWDEQAREIITVVSGASGTVGATPQGREATRLERLADIANWRFMRETGDITISGVRIATDRGSQAALTSAYLSLFNSFVSYIDWKTKSNTFIRLTLTEITPIVIAVAQHVQSSFTLEANLIEEVNTAALITDEAAAIAAINAVVIPTIGQIPVVIL